MTIDLAIHPQTGDLYLDGTDIATVTGRDAIAQEIAVRLRWWRREWFLDGRKGVPYLEELFENGVSEGTVRAILKREIEQVPGVVAVRSMEIALDRVTRRATVGARIETTEGDVTLSGAPVGRN